MSNKELIERLRNAATFGTCLEAADALELADKRIAELERKLAVAREALRYAGDEPNLDRARRIADAALAQIGGE